MQGQAEVLDDSKTGSKATFEIDAAQEYNGAIRETPVRPLILAAALSMTAPALAAGNFPTGDMPLLNPNAGAPSTRPPTSRYEAARRGGKLPKSLLNELPAADLYKAVYRRIGGCEVPIIVRYDIGGSGAGQRR